MITVEKAHKKKAEQTGVGQGTGDSGLQQEHRTEVTGELLVFQGTGVKGGRAEAA